MKTKSDSLIFLRLLWLLLALINRLLRAARTRWATIILMVGFLANVSGQDDRNLFPIFPRGIEGDTFSAIPFSGGPDSVRFQQVYDAAGFRVFGDSGPFLIRRIIFRSDDDGPGRGFFSRLPGFQINLSTTTRPLDGLSANFAENVGLDDLAVIPFGPFQGGADYVSGNHPQNFSMFITFATPFYYDPSQGNLLLDIRNFGGGSTTWGSPPFFGPAYVDAANILGDRVSSVSANSIDALSGTISSLGLVTQFWITPIPEPSTSILLAIALGTLVLRWKRAREK